MARNPRLWYRRSCRPKAVTRSRSPPPPRVLAGPPRASPKLGSRISYHLTRGTRRLRRHPYPLIYSPTGLRPHPLSKGNPSASPSLRITPRRGRPAKCNPVCRSSTRSLPPDHSRGPRWDSRRRPNRLLHPRTIEIIRILGVNKEISRSNSRLKIRSSSPMPKGSIFSSSPGASRMTRCHLIAKTSSMGSVLVTKIRKVRGCTRIGKGKEASILIDNRGEKK